MPKPAHFSVEKPTLTECTMRTQLLQESHHLLQIIPPEVWYLIAQQLDTNSLICLLNSCQFFRQLLLEKRVEILFQPVLNILSPYLLQHFKIPLEDYSSSSYGYPIVKPLKSLVLILRLVCRSWNKAIQDLSSVINFEECCGLPPGKSEIINQLTCKCYSLSSTKHSTAFLEKFTKSHAPTKSNPFLGQSLVITGPQVRGRSGDYGDPQIFFTQIPQILSLFGHHLCSLYFHLTWNFASERERHSKTVELLNYLPNLRNLTIIFKYIIFADFAEDTIPFINISNLQKLEFHDWPDSSFNLFVRQNPQIRQLVTNRHTHEYQYNLSPLVNLESLDIDLFSPYDQQVIFENPELTFTHLRKLRLHYRTLQNGSGDVQFVRWSSVFEILSQKLGDNEHFEELSLGLPKAENFNENKSILEDSLNERLVLKNLKKLSVRFYESKVSIDFVLGISKSLEELNINLFLDEADRVSTENMHNFLEELDAKNENDMKRDKAYNSHVIKFVGYASKMMEPNIWDVLPALKILQLKIYPSDVKKYVRE